MFFVVAVTTDLDSHRTDEASIDYLQVVVLYVEKLAFPNKLRKCQRSTGLSTTDHSPIEDQSGLGKVSPFVECTLNSLDELDLTVIRLDIESGEVLVIVGVVD